MAEDRAAPMCMVCVHYDDEGGGSCAAFPEYIPMPIWLEGADHRKPYPGDHGITFEPDTERWDDEMITVIMERYDWEES